MAYEDFSFETQEDEDRKQREAELNAATLVGAKLGAQWGAQAAVAQVAAALEPYAPAVVELAKQKALDETEKSSPGFKSFYDTPAYSRTLQARPKLKEAIEAAETNPQWQGDLPELYNIAYTIAAAQQGSTPQRWGESPGETSHGQAGQGPDLSTSEKRKAYIQELESRGIKDANLDNADITLGRKGGR